MTWLIGIDFRGSTGYVTDPSGYSPGYVAETGLAVVDYTAARGYGWESAATWGADVTTVNNDARIAGFHNTNDPTQATFRIDLPAAGTYQIQAAFGNPNGTGYTQRAELFDNNTSLAVIVNDQASLFNANYFSGFDAQDNSYDANTPGGGWIAPNPIGGGGTGARNFTFASTILRLKIGNPSGSSTTALAHLMVMQAGGTVLALAARGAATGQSAPRAQFTGALAARAAGAAAAKASGTFWGNMAMRLLALGTMTDAMSATTALSARGGAASAARGFFTIGTRLALVALGAARTMARGAASAAGPISGRSSGYGRKYGTLSASATLSARAAAGASVRGFSSTGARLALVALGAVRTMAQGAVSAAGPISGRSSGYGRKYGVPSASAALSARGVGGAKARGLLGVGSSALALVARAAAMTFGAGRAHCAVPLQASAKAQGKVQAPPDFAAPLTGRNMLTLSMVAPPAARASLAARGTSGAFARISSTHALALSARAAFAGAARSPVTLLAALLGRARGRGAAAAPPVALGAPQPTPEAVVINPSLEIEP